ncbi:hypothetical protein BDZ89DRAFT_1042231 [Hymenopellis radicata]|nr:hypothetical protein BDZ89DRAFT_1042231 [Hymenopellis radicata]
MAAMVPACDEKKDSRDGSNPQDPLRTLEDSKGQTHRRRRCQAALPFIVYALERGARCVKETICQQPAGFVEDSEGCRAQKTRTSHASKAALLPVQTSGLAYVDVYLSWPSSSRCARGPLQAAPAHPAARKNQSQVKIGIQIELSAFNKEWENDGRKKD